jgi:hypothetical protein
MKYRFCTYSHTGTVPGTVKECPETYLRHHLVKQRVLRGFRIYDRSASPPPQPTSRAGLPHNDDINEYHLRS